MTLQYSFDKPFGALKEKRPHLGNLMWNTGEEKRIRKPMGESTGWHKMLGNTPKVY